MAIAKFSKPPRQIEANDGSGNPVPVKITDLGSTKVSTWTLEGVSVDNTALILTKAAEAGKSHFITGVFVATDAAITDGVVATLKDGATTIGRLHLRDRREVPLGSPLKITAGAAFEVSIPAAGLNIASSIFVTGYTE